MKLLVDELPLYKVDCMFAKSRWSEDEVTWVTHCKISGERCDLVLDERGCGCSFLKGADDE